MLQQTRPRQVRGFRGARRPRLETLCALVLLAGCSDREEGETGETDGRPLTTFSLVEGGDSLAPDGAPILEFPLDPEGWMHLRTQRWARRLPTAVNELPWSEELGLALKSPDGRESFSYRPEAGLSDPLGPGCFGLRGDRLFVSSIGREPPEGSGADPAPPGELVLEVPLAPGERAADGRWRIRCGELSSDGFLVTPGSTIRRPLPVEVRGGRLHFWSEALGDPSSPATLRVHAGATLLLEASLRAGEGRRPWAAPLPEDADELRFELVGRGVFTAVHTPVVRRGEGSARPDLFVFLADTFRADNLGVYGSEDDLTPRLDEFAARAHVFTHAWSSANWTLPSHASLMLGKHVGQHGATSRSWRASRELVSVARHLRDQGYRTAAFSDGLFVSQRYGIDRGFEWFRERSDPESLWTLDQTLAELDAWLAASDGRPSFVFVQSYRVHGPYRVSEASRRTLADRLPLELSYEELERRMMEVRGDSEVGLSEWLEQQLFQSDLHQALDELGRSMGLDRPGELLERLRANYLGGVLDLDGDFGRFEELLDRHVPRDRRHLVFLSDHGEEFGEHGRLFHTDGYAEDLIRVPMLFAGPGLSPTRDPRPASLVDLPRTLSGLAGLAPHPAWEGRDLFTDARDAAIHVTDTGHRGEEWAILIEDSRKWAYPVQDGRPAEQPRHGWDLRADPGEREDLLAADGAEPPPLDPSTRQGLRDAWTPAAEPEAVQIAPQLKRLLERMGYVTPGEDESDGR